MTSGYTIAAVSRRVGVPPWTLRRWEAQGHIPPAKRHPINRYRVYSELDVRRIRATLRSLEAVDDDSTA